MKRQNRVQHLHVLYERATHTHTRYRPGNVPVTEKLTYRVSIDTDKLRSLANRAANNASPRAQAGPIIVEIITAAIDLATETKP